jgi:hypothetical protein
MKKTILAGGVCAVLTVPALLGTASGQSGAPSGTLELMQLERENRSGYVDNPPRRRESTGDVFTVAGRVRDTSRRAAGRVQGSFTQTGRGTAQGAVTFALAGGQVVIVGGLTGKGRDTFVIAGGTGAYAGATGSVQITVRRARTEFRFDFAG